MQKINKYVSDDGVEFCDEQKCIAYEALCKEVSEIMTRLPATPDLPSCKFENGGGYLQHDPAIANAARVALLKIANTIMPHKWFEQSIAGKDVHPSWAGRLIDEMDTKCLNTVPA